MQRPEPVSWSEVLDSVVTTAAMWSLWLALQIIAVPVGVVRRVTRYRP